MFSHVKEGGGILNKIKRKLSQKSVVHKRGKSVTREDTTNKETSRNRISCRYV